MLISQLFRAKRTFIKENGDVLLDIISSTFDFSKAEDTSAGYIQVKEEEQMRPDLVAERIYGDQKKWELLLKYNGISNPFSLIEGQILLVPPFRNLNKMLSSPGLVVEKGIEKLNIAEDKLLSPKTVKDKKRIDALKNKVKELVPPNVNVAGNKNVKVKNGKVIFGDDVTQINKDDCPVPISRARLIQQLIKSNLF